MRIIARKTLVEYWELVPLAENSLRAWYDEVHTATWKNPAELKGQYASASVISDKRVVFNIHGNRFRLIVDIEYRLQIIFIVWIGTHKEYDVIDARTVGYA
ncbi:MAG TPA: type II toxin-antitoxin system HigB family toxin [Candidatus Kapabacteria bacterium]|nr:type II toxin-antitoxin system HigB family toxin [Candidatus Kapabacteria bacterium]